VIVNFLGAVGLIVLGALEIDAYVNTGEWQWLAFGIFFIATSVALLVPVWKD